MPRYLTASRYRTLALGHDLAEKSDQDLQALADAASGLANGVCSRPVGYDFRGATVTGEEHIWDPGNSHQLGSGRLWPLMRPIRSVTGLQIYVTKTQHIDFTEDSIFTNKALGYCEPVGTPNTTALFTAVPPWGLTAEVALLDYDYGYRFSVFGEALATISGGLQAANQFWVDDDVELAKDGVVQAPSTYEADIEEGTIVPDDLDESALWTLSYTHRVPFNVARGTAMILTDLIGYTNINASGLSGLSGIKVEEIELRQSSRVGFNVDSVSPAARLLLEPYKEVSWG